MPPKRQKDGKKTNLKSEVQRDKIESFETASDALKDTHCIPCKEEGEHRSATKFCIDCGHSICQQCVAFHRRVKQIKEHKLIDLKDPGVLQYAQFLSQSLHCPNHQNRKIELICQDHNIMCCLTCATVKHRSCSNVFEVGDLAAIRDIKAEVRNWGTHLEAAKQHVVNIMKLQDSQKKKLQDDLHESLPNIIKDIKRKVNAMLTSLEANIQVKSREIANKEFQCYAMERNKWFKYLNLVEENIKVLDTVSQSGSGVHIFIALEKIKKVMSEIDHAILAQGSNMTLAQGIRLEEKSALSNIYDGICCPDELVNLSVEHVVASLQKYPYDIPESQCTKQKQYTESNLAP